MNLQASTFVGNRQFNAMKRSSMTLFLITALTTGLTAGIFLTWSCSVIPGLSRLSDFNYLSAMQSINRAIQNPVFFSCFFGAGILLPIAVFRNYTGAWTPQLLCLITATGVYLVGVLGVTIFGNVPLNEALDVAQIDAGSPQTLAAHRAAFENSWNRLNQVRTVAGIAAFALLLVAGWMKSEQ
jgi:uncharacterized membrane protein